MKRKILSYVMVMVTILSILSCITFPAAAAGDSTTTAEWVSFGQIKYDRLTESTPKNYYRINLPSSGKITINVNAYIQYTSYYLYDGNSNEIWSSTGNQWNGQSEKFTGKYDVNITGGTYYFAVGWGYYSWGYKPDYSTGDYDFKIAFTSAKESVAEALNGINQQTNEASQILPNTSYNGQLAINDSADYYKCTLPSSGRITIDATAFIPYTNYRIYDEDSNEIWSSTGNQWNSQSEKFTLKKALDLNKGTYYFAVSWGYYSWGYKSDYSTGNYNFKISFSSAKESFTEPQWGNNQKTNEATSILIGSTYRGQLAHTDSADYYKFTLSSHGRIAIKLNANIEYTNYHIYDGNSNSIWSSTGQHWDNESEKYTLNEVLILNKGTYYFAVSWGYYSWGYKPDYSTGNYTFSISGYTGLCKIDDTLTYLKNGIVATNFTGLVKYSEDGKWYFVQNGKVNFAKTGLIKHTDGKWYFVQSGKVNLAKTGLVKHTNGKWYFVQAGKVNFSKTGLVQHSNGNWYYVQGGSINFAKTGLVKHTNGSWYYVRAGMVRFGANTLIKHTDGKWYYVKGGKVTFATTLVKYNGAWYFVQGGKVNFAKTGLVKYGANWYFVQKGKVNFAKTGLVKHTNGAWYYVRAGMVRFGANTLIKHTDGKWYYVKGGKVNFAKTGLVKHTDGKWYFVQKGKVNFAKTSLVKHTNGKWYFVQKGKVNFAYNGRVLYNGRYYTVRKGVKI